MGVVYRAIDTTLQRPVALKVLAPGSTADPSRHRRLLQEARAASSLNHPHIVTVYEVDEKDGVAFIAMELVQGTPLDVLLAKGPLKLEQSLTYATQIAEALDAAHGAGIVHRDIKPANIIITASGAVKVLDFGLAKLVERSAVDATISVVGTTAGAVVGTAAYMSPEQAQGLPVDARTDIFSLGAVMFEMLTGRRAFAGASQIGVLTAILRDDPPAIRTLTNTVPLDVDMIVRRALSKDPAERYPNAATLRCAIAGVRDRLMRPRDAVWRRPSVLASGAAALLAAVAFGGWQTVEARRARWARLEAVPEIERLNLSGRSMNAVRLARAAEPYAPEAVASARAGWGPFRIVTEPADAQVEARNYSDLDGPWEFLGTSPVQVSLPLGYYRVRVTKKGYRTLEVSAFGGRSPVKLTPEADAAPGMVFVPGGPYQTGAAPSATLPNYWIDQLEVTNAAFKRFVDAGGYRDAKYWKEPFRDGNRTLSFDAAMARFTDSTGRSGPATWELGSFPDGHGDYPVGGISWFEAAAYAEFVGKSLPTLYHWFRASGIEDIYSDILQLSNFDGKGPMKAGARPGLGPWGTLDMAGNVKEWCTNEATGRQLRYILGGGWNEPSYRFKEADAQNPWGRVETYGVRLVKNLGGVGETAVPIGRIARDPKSIVPVSNELFDVYRHYYDYDRSPLNAQVESVDDSSMYWRKEKVSFAAAYGMKRVPAFLFVPKNAKPPYQTIVNFPSAYALFVPTSANLDIGTFEFLMRGGRAVMYPIYQGTFERRGDVQPGPAGVREMEIQWAKDLFRAVDYLETRNDIDMQHLGYYSLSMGAFYGPIPVSLEPRIKAAVFAAGGLRYERSPQNQPANFMPHVKVPVLLVNGKDDFAVNDEERQRFFELLGTSESLKKRVALDGGHVPQDMRGLFREVLAWYDTHLGAVK
jgi:formylglycine-generating enzyme required for sulfatase activity/dienelactone hydrolase